MTVTFRRDVSSSVSLLLSLVYGGQKLFMTGNHRTSRRQWLSDISSQKKKGRWRSFSFSWLPVRSGTKSQRSRFTNEFLGSYSLLLKNLYVFGWLYFFLLTSGIFYIYKGVTTVGTVIIRNHIIRGSVNDGRQPFNHLTYVIRFYWCLYVQ